MLRGNHYTAKGISYFFSIANKPVGFLKTEIATIIKEAFDELSFVSALSGVAISPETHIPGRYGGKGLQVVTRKVLKIGTGFENVKGALDSQEQGGVESSKGEQGTKVVFFKPFNITDKNDADSKVKTIPLLRTFTVFNTDQIENLPEKYTVKNDAPVIEFINNEAADSLLSHAVIEHGGQRACFIPSADKIQLPARESFITVSDYYATALHELTHWTGHKSRLARNFDGRFGSNAYAFEELIAELGAAFFCSSTGIDGKLQHDSYIANWLQVLKGDKRAIFTAASAARKAVELVAGKPEEEAMVLSA